MFNTIITDCSDANAQGRQETRARILLGITPTFVPIPGTLDAAASLEASGNIVDILDAAGDAEGIVLANVAPRHGEERHWGNGTPFGYFKYRHTLVVTTISGLMLSLPKKLGLVEQYKVIDMQQTLERMCAGGVLTKEDVEYIAVSQFRSYDFLPRVATWLVGGSDVVAEGLPLHDIPAAGNRIWGIDNFGNAKTTLLAHELPESGVVHTRWGDLPVVRSLKDVPDNSTAIIIGSSGLGEDRFAEVVMQGASAAQTLSLKAGMQLTETS